MAAESADTRSAIVGLRRPEPRPFAASIGQPPADGQQPGDTLPPMLRPQQSQADAHHDHEQPKFEILPAVHKTVPRPQMLRHRHRDQFNGNQQQKQSAQPRAPRFAVRGKEGSQPSVKRFGSQTTSQQNIRLFALSNCCQFDPTSGIFALLHPQRRHRLNTRRPLRRDYRRQERCNRKYQRC